LRSPNNYLNKSEYSPETAPLSNPALEGIGVLRQCYATIGKRTIANKQWSYGRITEAAAKRVLRVSLLGRNEVEKTTQEIAGLMMKPAIFITLQI